jgi:hypothetical protein
MGTNPVTPRPDEATGRRIRKSVLPCDLYVPGHQVHYIQAKRAALGDDPVSWGRLDSIDREGVITVEFLDRVERYWNHRPEEIQRVAQRGDKVRIARRWGLLSVHRRFEKLITVCIADADAPLRPCSVADGPTALDDLSERLLDRGGFIVPGRDVVQWSGPDPAA